MRINRESIPLGYQTDVVAEEFNMNVSTCALNGGEDYELLFTVPLTGNEFELKAQGWNHMGGE